ncbi:amidohydrolase [Pseudoclavibacter sp. RFBG4]|uniref:amidohydrolase n=1 Tax=Pseudoclavibacter sp. RFBG4 TaxID=2080575 RepID=UPI000CE7750A|nr:amidohydrolase [Pseudoclavibacter sp. RFBG4]PPG26592.1 amidohydrolase [Pseudoclavibacter sp. RFBG4]
MRHIEFTGGTIGVPHGTPDVTTLVVHDGTIVTANGRSAAGRTERIDLAGGYLGPAFGDGHAHPLFAGLELQGPQIRGAGSVADIVESVRLWADAHPEATWIVGGSYDSTLAPLGRFDAAWLDAAVPDRPVVLRSWDYHSAWCNTAALEAAGITADTVDPEDGVFVRREDGTPLGTLLESGAVERVLGRAPRRPVTDGVEALRASTAVLASLGITWVQEAWVEPADIEVWVTAAEAGALCVDADLAQRADPKAWPQQRTLLRERRTRIEAAPGLTAQTVKFFLDGIIENHTAHLLEDYADACTRGLPVWHDGELQQAALDAHELGFDLHLHAIGDAGVRSALGAARRIRERPDGADRRITIAHVQLLDDSDLDRFTQLDVTACFQPLWATADEVMVQLTLPLLGPGRELHYRMRSLLESGARLSFGSDWPVTSPDVLAGIRTAVTRQNPDGTPLGGWHPAERISVDAALEAATSAVAYQARAETTRGTLTPGSRADLVWLSADPRDVAPDQLGDITVLGTWRNGQRTF